MSRRRRKLASNGRLYDAALFTVEGDGVFPFDMLRYDTCWPYTEGQDSAAMCCWGDTSPNSRTRRRVVLQTYSANAPTEGRWKSFGWRLVGIGELREATP